ncbi:MAG: hypothetical protein IJ659_08035 [Alloprevotella sp.]|nr:hypothetical protein [Alloprevotella sp.]
MKHFRLAAIVFAAVVSSGAVAQQATEAPGRSIYLELLGASNGVGVSYDARFKTDSPWGYRIGLGYTYSKEYSMFSGSKSLRGPDVPLEINYLLGKKRSKLDLGLGLNLGYYTEKYDTWNMRQVGEEDGIPHYEYEYAGEAKHSLWGYFFFGNIGYRYQPKRGFQFRAGISPSFNLGGKHAVTKAVFPYVSFGYVF